MIKTDRELVVDIYWYSFMPDWVHNSLDEAA